MIASTDDPAAATAVTRVVDAVRLADTRHSGTSLAKPPSIYPVGPSAVHVYPDQQHSDRPHSHSLVEQRSSAPAKKS